MAKTNASGAPKLSSPRAHEVIRPPQSLRHKVRYSKLPPGIPGPVERAEIELEAIAGEFDNWLHEDAQKLVDTWSRLNADPRNAEAFRNFSAQVHLIKGNAPLLGCKAAGDIAEPVAALLERCPRLEDFERVVALATKGISIAIEEHLEEDDPRVTEICTSLHGLVQRWKARYEPTPHAKANWTDHPGKVGRLN